MKKSEEFYKGLKEKLDENTQFPTKYMYKFIVPTTKKQSEEIIAVFDNRGAVIQTKASKNGKFISVSITINVKNSEEIIKNYRSVEHIEGLISL